MSDDKGGNLYFIGQRIDSAELGVSAISATTWNGAAWRAPQILIEDGGSRGVFSTANEGADVRARVLAHP